SNTFPVVNVLSAPIFFFFNAPPTTDIYTLSLHDALPISSGSWPTSTRARPRRPSASSTTPAAPTRWARCTRAPRSWTGWSRSRRDRKSTRLNSSHVAISYAVFCLKKKKKTQKQKDKEQQQ